MKMNKTSLVSLLVVIIAAFFAFKQQEKPTLYIIGDSTVRNSNKEFWGWGSLIDSLLNTDKIAVNNQAMAGRSTRTFIKEKRWFRVDSMLKPGDFVMMQFGHNEGSKPDTTRAGYRGVLRGTGEETKELIWPDGTKETVHSYGAYLRKFIRETKAKGATPIVLSMIPRNQWDDKGKVKRTSQDFGLWAKTIAEEEGVAFIDLNSLSADKYDLIGPDAVKANYFPGDHTHTNRAGAKVNAESVAEGLRLLKDHPLKQFLKY
jgi:rhamnogalacturonan acetylesterase